MRRVDCHSHIIPYIDDGAKNATESIKLLTESFKQGVSDIFVTPHFNGEEKDLSAFLEKRASMLDILKSRIEKENISAPNIYAGAEVVVSAGLSSFSDLKPLCIEGTDYILLEMPFSNWHRHHFTEIERIIKEHGLTPIIAHVERYFKKPVDWEMFDRLNALDAVFQFNAPSFCKRSMRAFTDSFIQKCKNKPIVLGSDCHDPKFRTTVYGKACAKIEKYYGEDFLNKIHSNSVKIIKNEKFYEQL